MGGCLDNYSYIYWRKWELLKVLIIGWIGDGADGNGKDLAGSWGSRSEKGTELVLLHWKKKSGTRHQRCSLNWTDFAVTWRQYIWLLHQWIQQGHEPLTDTFIFLFIYFYVWLINIHECGKRRYKPQNQVYKIISHYSHAVPILSIFILYMSEQYIICDIL